MRTPKDNSDVAEAPKKAAIKRRERVPFGKARQKLSVKNLPEDSVGRWVNDRDGHVEELLDRGYSFVDKKGVFVGEEVTDGNAALDSRVSKVVGRDEAGRPIVAYLMATPKEFYEEDQKAKAVEIDAVDSAIRQGQHSRAAGDNRYIPESVGGIKIGSKDNYKP